MPMKRGHVSAPQNTFIDTIIRKFDAQSMLNCLSSSILICVYSMSIHINKTNIYNNIT